MMAGELILLVDDIPANLELLEDILHFAKYRVETAKSGEAALQLLANGLQPDLIGLDVMMPSMDGFELAQRIKALDAFKQTPIVFLSANHNRSELDRAKVIGAVDYIAKPYGMQDVIIRIQAAISAAQSSKPTE